MSSSPAGSPSSASYLLFSILIGRAKVRRRPSLISALSYQGFGLTREKALTSHGRSWAALAAGWLSDRIARRKPLVFAGSFIMALAVAAPLLAPNIEGMLLYAGLIGLGYGAFMSVDLALMTQVLPESLGESTGRDLGILTTAINIPQILSPVFAAWLLSISGHDYRSLFIASAAFIVAGSLFVLPIRSVR